MHYIFAILLALAGNIQTLHALQVKITKEIPYVDVDVNGKNIRIQRIQDTNHKLKNSYTKTSRPTPPFNIQPYQPIAGVQTVSELDVIEFIKNQVSENRGLLIDARMPKWYNKGTIPGAVNIPFSIFATQENDTFIKEIFSLFDVEKKNNSWDFSEAQTLLLFDNGPWCQQAVRAMQHLISLGYPKNKILYYRGGLQFWQILGLTLLFPEE
jgi:3-mercaptopyruvate sulfurtransferase SseA